MVGKPSSRSVIGGGEFKLTSFEVAKIEIFLFDKSGSVVEDTHGSANPNMMRVLFKAPTNNTSTHKFSDFIYGTWDPPQLTSDFFPPPPAPEETSSPCDKIDRNNGRMGEMVYQDCTRTMNTPFGEMLKNDPEFFDMIFGPFLKDEYIFF